jgi:hypothetical protein
MVDFLYPKRIKNIIALDKQELVLTGISHPAGCS